MVIADAGVLRRRHHRVHQIGDALVDVDGEALDGCRLGDVAQVVEHAPDQRELALEGAPEGFAVLGSSHICSMSFELLPTF